MMHAIHITHMGEHTPTIIFTNYDVIIRRRRRKKNFRSVCMCMACMASFIPTKTRSNQPNIKRGCKNG